MNASTMSSETLTKGPAKAGLHETTLGQNFHSGDDALQPWQLFTLGGLAAATAVVFAAKETNPAGIVLLSLTVGASAWLGLAAWRTLAPLFGFHHVATTEVLGGRTRAALEREKVLVLRAIKDLDFDRAMGKVADKDFAEMSARLRARAAGLLRQLDRGAGYRDEIERELAKRVGGPAPAVDTGLKTRDYTPPMDAGLKTTAVDAGLQTRDQMPPVDAGLQARDYRCTCGTINDVDARFCKSCGSRLQAA
jgi:hypothetical protein